jgi:hypothetical protein
MLHMAIWRESLAAGKDGYQRKGANFAGISRPFKEERLASGGCQGAAAAIFALCRYAR